jgi:transposase-like protein
MKTQPKRGATGAKRGARTLAYPVEFRLRIVKLFLEEGYSTGLLCEQFGISSHSIHRWVKTYRLKGAEGLEPRRQIGRRSRVADGSRSWLPKYPPGPESSSSLRWHGGWQPSSGW